MSILEILRISIFYYDVVEIIGLEIQNYSDYFLQKLNFEFSKKKNIKNIWPLFYLKFPRITSLLKIFDTKTIFLN